jgi:pyruvate dehydrogenase E1 component
LGDDDRARNEAVGADGDSRAGASILDELFPPSRRAPLVTVLDGHPHALSFLGALSSGQIACLGVNDFGQSGDVQDLYRHFGIDAEEIAGAAFDLIE